jgi:hypothetical protein
VAAFHNETKGAAQMANNPLLSEDWREQRAKSLHEQLDAVLNAVFQAEDERTKSILVDAAMTISFVLRETLAEGGAA